MAACVSGCGVCTGCRAASYTSQNFFRRTGSNIGNSEIVLIYKGPRILNLYEGIIKREGMKRAPRMIGKFGECQLEHGVTDVLHTHALHVLFPLLPPLFVFLLYCLPVPFPIAVSLYRATFIYSLLLHFRSLPSRYNTYSRWTAWNLTHWYVWEWNISTSIYTRKTFLSHVEATDAVKIKPPWSRLFVKLSDVNFGTNMMRVQKVWNTRIVAVEVRRACPVKVHLPCMSRGNAFVA